MKFDELCNYALINEALNKDWVSRADTPYAFTPDGEQITKDLSTEEVADIRSRVSFSKDFVKKVILINLYNLLLDEPRGMTTIVNTLTEKIYDEYGKNAAKPWKMSAYETAAKALFSWLKKKKIITNKVSILAKSDRESIESLAKEYETGAPDDSGAISSRDVDRLTGNQSTVPDESEWWGLDR